MSVGAVQPFKASANANAVTITATTTSSQAALPAAGSDLLVVNSGAVLAFLSVGTTATTSDTPLPPGSTTLLSIGPYANAIAVITASGTTTVVACRGDGSTH
jgi:hypothetical protein